MFSDKEWWTGIATTSLKIVGIIILAIIFKYIVKAAIANVFKVRLKSPLRLSERRENTLFRLLDNVASYVIYFVAILTILTEFGVDIKAILAGAGVVGLAIGFGAQSLVKDIITGFFIIFENQFSVGDTVRITNFEGTVEEIGLRTTKIKSWTGELHILPNSSITEVTNFSVHNSIAVVDLSIAYEEDIDKAQNIIQEVVKNAKPNYPEMVKEPEVLGVQMLGASEVVIRVTAEVLPMTHFKIARELRKTLKHELEVAGIEIPYPKMVTYQKEPLPKEHK
ncbi:mechanosensitive ion channel family protein [Fictibacillus nanhaiensis]|uniref:Mechanosensitive ion channel protein MscS n=2 Tax=Fictibacillus TaxID=1329200 RepID=A0A160ISR5_9BACL|nr:mechanosensitive ion channel family protein [Fictibacillus phosphorivorans]ANC79490.1 mechanosensitive ion channel protein MscS [Fictibacillus phosphorivorans]MBH0168775.1 mechanosensitive ion channel family protein [Fictibacillus sp. 18YEL24]MBN3553619.1 mechanosensitive ion channel family protein [Fictibacillus nanhaiensis]